jgi:hypothetical protein
MHRQFQSFRVPACASNASRAARISRCCRARLELLDGEAALANAAKHLVHARMLGHAACCA